MKFAEIRTDGEEITYVLLDENLAAAQLAREIAVRIRPEQCDLQKQFALYDLIEECMLHPQKTLREQQIEDGALLLLRENS